MAYMSWARWRFALDAYQIGGRPYSTPWYLRLAGSMRGS